MSWNGSNSTSTTSGKRSAANGSVHSPSRKASLSRGIFAGLLVVIIGGAAVWWLGRGRSPSGPQDGRDRARPSQIAEVEPQISTNKVEEMVTKKPRVKPYSELTREEKLAMYEKQYGTNVPDNLKSTVYFLKHPPEVTYHPLPRRVDIFEHDSERTIASVLLIEPGTFVMRRTTYDESFDDDFKKSLETPTLLSKDDTPEERELKEAVNEVKADLAERMRKGEKPSDILTAAMDTAYELGKYKQDIQEMIHDANDDPSMSDEDVEDFVTAANKMLKEKGASEIEMPSLVKRQVRLRNRARRAELESAKETENK